ncbi:hypothetical protein UCREL1_8722 [Eutypa lata UCREL1]|uniref:Uncharacterized protein n=1 Tax=Eutypa lata (strain UCR-EL1) TaxID=1287681 RepID=M7SDJ6_EUTLA|nr:hypothetical protein UCREL1_8722 [Eutypa lata UCREL1]
MPHITVSEPHPTVVKNHYTHAGRGGAGNYFRAPATTPASGVPTAPSVSAPTTNTSSSRTTTTQRFYSGRGGAGNLHVAPKPPAMSFDEEYERHAHIEAKPVGHVGRGGAGNVFDHTHTHAHAHDSSSRKTSDASSLASSSSSGSGRSAGILERLSKTLSRNH